jgi:hypothetical protein
LEDLQRSSPQPHLTENAKQVHEIKELHLEAPERTGENRPRLLQIGMERRGEYERASRNKKMGSSA